MKFHKLKEFEPSLELLYPKGEENNLDILGLTDFFALEADHILFVRNQKYFQKVINLDHHHMGLVLSQALFKELQPRQLEQIKDHHPFLAKVKNVDLAMSRLSYPYYLEKVKMWNNEVDGRQMGTVEVHPSAYLCQNVFLGKGVKIGAHTRIYPGAVILSDVEIGQNCEIFPHVCLYPQVKIGDRVRLHAGVSVGADGFGYNFEEGNHLKVWHMGGVIIEDDVEIGANSCVDQGTFSPTLIGRGTKIDNQVQVGHNCRIGKSCILCGQVAIGGSSRVGDFCTFGGKAGMGDHLVLGKSCRVAGAGMVSSSWGDGVTLGGHPAQPLREWQKSLVLLRQLSLKREKQRG